MEQVKLLSMTAIVTVLVWAGADSLVNETIILPVSFEVASLLRTDVLVELDPADRARLFEVELAGPRGLVEGLERPGPIKLRLGIEDRPTGPVEILLRKEHLKAALAQYSSEFRKVSVVGIQPPSIQVSVDHLVTRDVDITMDRMSLAYDEEPQLKTSTVSVRMRESVVERFTRAGRRLALDISADVERLLKEKAPGTSAQVLVLLNGAELGQDAEISPNPIEVTATLKADRVTADVPTVPIKPVVSFANLSRPYRAVSRDGTPIAVETRTITVTGPAEDVSKLLRGDTRAYGFIHLKEADLAEPGVIKVWTPEFHLPPRIELAKQPDPIEFKLTNISQAESTEGS